jgi:hypothetical protein
MNQNDLSRRKELEVMFQKFPDIPKEMVVQEDTYRLGFAFTEQALRALEPYANKQYVLFTYDRVKSERHSLHESDRVPFELFLTGGIYGLRGRTTVNTRINPSSPYIVDVIDGKVSLCERENGNRNLIALIGQPNPVPPLLSKCFEDGSRYGESIWIPTTREWVGFNLFRMCQYWGHKEECKFCDINSAARQQTKLGWRSKREWFEKVDHVAQIVEDAFLHEEWYQGKRPRSVFFTGGAILKKVNGLQEDDFYLRYVEAVRSKIGGRYPIYLQTAPKTKEIAKKYKDAGVTAHETNIEVWDEKLFNIICPGKAKYIGRDNWIKLMLDEVDVFGEGYVSPCMVAGLEMCQPWGFDSIDEAIKSVREGFEFMMSHGVLPRPLEWAIEEGSALKDNNPPPLEFFVRYMITWYESWIKYRLPPVPRYNSPGEWREECCRGWLRLAADGIYGEVPILEDKTSS